MKQGKKVAESLKPTFENVTNQFLMDTLYDIFFRDDYPKFQVKFCEQEAIDFINEKLTQIARYEKERKEKILQKLLDVKNEKDEVKNSSPVMLIRDYKRFFELLRQGYEELIRIYFERTSYSSFPVYEMENFFREIWLRTTPEDFNNIERFLEKQVNFMRDETLKKYDIERCLGKVELFDNHFLCIRNRYARTWDENFREFVVTIYDKRYYENEKLRIKPHVELPVIRYGIYEKDGQKICSIGSIQRKEFLSDKNKEVSKKVEKVKYQLNKGVINQEGEDYIDYVKNREGFYPENISDVEPKQILALGIFFAILVQEGITEIEAPCMYVLDYDYHQKRNDTMLKNFEKEWNEYQREKEPEEYERALYYFSLGYKKEEMISQNKSERFIRLFRRMIYHYPQGEILSYPGDVDNYLHLRLPKNIVKTKIKSKLLQQCYGLVKEKYDKKEVEL